MAEPQIELLADGVWRVSAGVFKSNAYLCATPQGDFVIDPGLDPETIDSAVRSLGLNPRYVFCTHGHFDHIGGAAHFQKTYGADVFVHSADTKLMKSGNFMLMVLKIDQRITLPEPIFLSGEAPFEVAGGLVTYRPTPGHTPGSCLISFGEHVFSGDTLYARGVGLSSLPGENLAQLRRSLRALWDVLPHEALIHPGHGPSARFGAIKTGNQPLLDFLAQPDDAPAQSEAKANG